MANTFRAPTQDEIDRYQQAIDLAIRLECDASKWPTLIRSAIEGIFGECVYKRVDKYFTQVTQCALDSDWVQVQFNFNADLT